MNMIRMVEAFNLFLAVLFTLAYAYQLVYLFLGLIRRKHWKQPDIHTRSNAQIIRF